MGAKWERCIVGQVRLRPETTHASVDGVDLQLIAPSVREEDPGRAGLRNHCAGSFSADAQIVAQVCRRTPARRTVEHASCSPAGAILDHAVGGKTEKGALGPPLAAEAAASCRVGRCDMSVLFARQDLRWWRACHRSGVRAGQPDRAGPPRASGVRSGRAGQRRRRDAAPSDVHLHRGSVALTSAAVKPSVDQARPTGYGPPPAPETITRQSAGGGRQ